MLKTHYYNIHDIIEMKIQRNRILPDLFRDINLRFSYFETKKIEKPSLIINIGRFLPKNNGSFLVDHQYHIDKGYFYCKDNDKTARWKLEICGIEEETTILNFNSFILGLHQVVYPDIFAQNLIGRFLLQYKLAQKGFFMIHAGSVVKDDQAIVFAGRGGANKTSLLMDLIKNHNFTFQGDDWIIFNKDNIYSFPTHFHEFNFKMNNLADEKPRGNIDRLRLFYHLNKKFDYRNCTVNVQKHAKIKMLNILIKTNNAKLKINKDADLSTIKNFLYYNNKIEENETSMSMGLKTKGISKYLQAYSFIYPDNSFRRSDKKFNEAIDTLIENCNCNIIEVPSRYSQGTGNEIFSFITDNI